MAGFTYTYTEQFFAGLSMSLNSDYLSILRQKSNWSTNRIAKPYEISAKVYYRRLSLSQSPGDQIKYFELSVV